MALTNEVYPEARFGASTEIDEQGEVMIMFGGYTIYGPRNDLWQFWIENQYWKQIFVNGIEPDPRHKAGSFIVNRQNSHYIFYIFGGEGFQGPLNDV